MSLVGTQMTVELDFWPLWLIEWMGNKTEHVDKFELYFIFHELPYTEVQYNLLH